MTTVPNQALPLTAAAWSVPTVHHLTGRRGRRAWSLGGLRAAIEAIKILSDTFLHLKKYFVGQQ